MNPTKEELNEAIANLKLLIEGDWKLSRPIQKTIITILTRYRDGELVEKDRWISVKERLPELDCNVLCYSHGDHIEGYYCSIDKKFKPEIDDAGHMENDIMVIDVTHWQPLPTPPTNQTER